MIARLAELVHDLGEQIRQAQPASQDRDCPADRVEEVNSAEHSVEDEEHRARAGRLVPAGGFRAGRTRPGPLAWVGSVSPAQFTSSDSESIARHYLGGTRSLRQSKGRWKTPPSSVWGAAPRCGGGGTLFRVGSRILWSSWWGRMMVSCRGRCRSVLVLRA